MDLKLCNKLAAAIWNGMNSTVLSACVKKERREAGGNKRNGNGGEFGSEDYDGAPSMIKHHGPN